MSVMSVLKCAALALSIIALNVSVCMAGAIHEAAKAGDTAQVKSILKDTPGAMTQPDSNGITALHHAAFKGRLDVVKLLIGAGADVNAEDNSGGTPLHAAVIGGHADVAGFLIASGANIEAKEADGWTPLYTAAYTGRKELVMLLLAKGADPLAKDFGGRTPVYAAQKAGHAEILQILQERTSTSNDSQGNAR